MRVTIEHRQSNPVLTQSTKHHFVDCNVEFSEEEKVIIKARNLSGHSFTVDSATPRPSGIAVGGSGLLAALGRLGIVAGIVLAIIANFKGGLFETLAALSFFGGVAIWIYATLLMRKQDKRIESSLQTVTLKRLLNSGRFTVHATSPAQAELVEHEIRTNLANTKQLIARSADIKAKQTFEL